MYIAVDCTVECFIQFGDGERTSVVLRWTVLKIFYTGWLGGVVFRYTAVDNTEDCFIQVAGGSIIQV